MTVVATQPIAFLGAGVPEQKPKTGTSTRSRPSRSTRKGKGAAGDLAPAAKVKLGTR